MSVERPRPACGEDLERRVQQSLMNGGDRRPSESRRRLLETIAIHAGVVANVRTARDDPRRLAEGSVV